MSNSEILFLKQEDVIKAGLLDMRQIIAAVEKTYSLLGQGFIKNPPKVRTRIPDEEHWTSFFNSMPCYIGGDVNIAGVKWAAESKKNVAVPGLPLGIDITIISDPETVLPLCVLDGTLITAMRTGAVAGVLAKYTASKSAKTAALIGAGVIGRTAVMAICEAVPSLEEIILCDLDITKAEAVSKEFAGKYNIKITPSTDSESASKRSQVIVTETTAGSPFLKPSWVEKGATVINMGSNEVELDVVRQADAVFVDYWTQMVTYMGKAVAQLHAKGEMEKEDVVEISELVLNQKPGRTGEDQTLFCASMGIGALDIMIGYSLFQNAKKMGIGTKLNLWDKPLWE